MTPRTISVALTLLGCLAVTSRAQMVPAPPGRHPSPLLFVRLSGPAGLRTTFFQGRAPGRGFDAPVQVGLRPGYLYRFEVSHIPGRPGVSFYPTLEVRGSLELPPKLGAAAFPAPIVLTEADIESVLSGALVTKVVYLEHPDRAIPTATQPGAPIEADLPARTDLLAEARTRGRPLIVVRMGGRLLVTPEELADVNTPGTILFPGEKALSPPAGPPCVLCDPRPFVDPRLGPRGPEEECLHDGGDRGARAGLGPDGSLYGLDPEDTVAEFTDSHGRRGLTCSNRVCLCVPRYAVLRSELPLGNYDTVVGVTDARKIVGRGQVEVRQPSWEANRYEQLQGLVVRQRPNVNVGTEGVVRIDRVEVLDAQALSLGPIALLGTKYVLQLTEAERALLVRQIDFARTLSIDIGTRTMVGQEGTAVVGRIQGGPQVVSGQVATREFAVCCGQPLPCPPDKPLILIKCADRTSAQLGDIVTFFLTYSNHGGRAITDVAVSDSLSPRLEYVPDSAKSDRPAVFTTQANEAGSQVLRWEITGTLQPGQSGHLRFQARIR